MPIATPYLLFLGDVPDALAAKTAYGVVDWRRDWCVGPDAAARLPGRYRAARHGNRGGAGCRRAHAGGRRRQCRRRAAGALDRDDRRGDLRRHGRGERPACPARLDSRHPRRGGAPRRRAPRRPPCGPHLRHGQGNEAAGQAPADGRDRLLGRQEIHRARARSGDDAGAASTRSSARPDRPAC